MRLCILAGITLASWMAILAFWYALHGEWIKALFCTLITLWDITLVRFIYAIIANDGDDYDGG